MDTDTILEVINNIPVLLKFFIPGAISMKLFAFLYKKEEFDYEYFIFKSTIISGLIVYPLQVIYTKWNDFALFVCTIILGILGSYAAVKILESDETQKVLQKFHIRKTTRCFWDDVIDMKRGSYVEVKLKDDDNRYIGSVEYLEDKSEGDIYISVTNIIIITPDEKKIKQDKNVRVVFNTANVELLIFRDATE